MLYKVSVVERLAFQSVMNIASCLTGKKKKGMPIGLRHAKLKIRKFWSLACQYFYQELRISFKPVLSSKSFWEDGNVLSTFTLSGMIATSHMWLLGTWNVASATEEIHFDFI